jgi:hypothetical protein
MNTSLLAQDLQNIVRTSKFFSFYLELYKNIFEFDSDQYIQIFISRTAFFKH